MARSMTTLLATVDAHPRYIANDPRPSLIGLSLNARHSRLAHQPNGFLDASCPGIAMSREHQV